MNRRKEPSPEDLDRLREELEALKNQIWENERIWSGFRFIEISLIGVSSFYDLVNTLAIDFPRAFPSVDTVTVACFDPDYEMTRLLERASPDNSAHESFVRVELESLLELFSSFDRPMLGRSTERIQALLFPHCPYTLGSVAIAPLVLQDRLIGCLNQGSRNPGHFSADAATDLLEHLAAVTAVCIDNTINQERLKEDGLTDALTHLANRRFFERRLREEVERWVRHGKSLTCMLIDLDHFKDVNDRYGHQTGDLVLTAVSQLLAGEMRASDVLARYGGEEFVLLFPDTLPEQVADIAERLRQRVADAVIHADDGAEIRVTFSAGLAGLDPDSALNSEEACTWLVRQADMALYHAKQHGRNRIELAQRPAPRKKT